MKPDNLHDRLRSLGSHITGSAPKGTGTTSPRESEPFDVPGRYHRLARSLDARLIFDPAGCFCLREHRYAIGHPFGCVELKTGDPNRYLPRSAFTALEEEGGCTISDLLFFDIESTGLGGSGTVPFLIGAGKMQPDGFTIRQYLLPDYSDEAAMLQHFLNEFTGGTVLVSYNGTAFDAPVITDRLIVNRLARALPDCDHLDLLHGTRRLFRRRLGDCSLVNIERELFAFFRDDDIPGYLIPSVYFDWVQEDNLTDMAAVLEHNRLDILTMYFLTIHLADTFATQGDNLDENDDIHSLSRVYGRRKDSRQVLRLYRRLETGEQTPLADDVLWHHSLNLKRLNAWDEAVSLWERLAEGETREAMLAHIELAKFFEHRARDYKRARHHARAARSLCPVGRPLREALSRRLARLKNRLNSAS